MSPVLKVPNRVHRHGRDRVRSDALIGGSHTKALSGTVVLEPKASPCTGASLEVSEPTASASAGASTTAAGRGRGSHSPTFARSHVELCHGSVHAPWHTEPG